jgi:hexosaminidase
MKPKLHKREIILNRHLTTVFLIVSLIISMDIHGAQNKLNSIIPLPERVEVGTGRFRLTIGTPIIATGKTHRVGKYLSGFLSRTSGSVIRLVELTGEKADRRGIILKTDPELEYLGPEGYLLKIDPESVRISASSEAGVFYGCQTLRQLLPPTVESSELQHAAWELPCLTIEDKPRFVWRGLMVDCSRTFQTADYLKRLIDILALYKLNVLHLHLTDDQGWRLEIKKYPRLTSTGARFPDSYRKVGGYYTQEQIREIISYAAVRQVTIVPEIEMPGHCLAALASYPELSCTGGPFAIYPFFKGPNIQENVYCAGKEETFKFLENVLEEVLDIFPCRYVHVGGDEVPKTQWEKCRECQARIKSEGLQTEEELQSYFIKRIEKFLNSKNKTLIGWDEIIEGGLAPQATVMSWRGMQGGIEAALHGHDVVMSPTSHCYLDYDHETISVEKAYSFEPVPIELSEDRHRHILGLQGNMWTHIAVNEPAFDTQVFPRLISLSEVGWTAKNNKNWKDFSRRLESHYSRLGALGVELNSERMPPP